MKLTQREIIDISNGKSGDWKAIAEKCILGKRLLTYTCEGIFQHIPTGKHYRLTWDISEYDLPVMKFDPSYTGHRVAEIEPITVTIWVPVEKEEK